MTKKMIDKRAIIFAVMIVTVVAASIFIGNVLCNLEAEVNRNEEIKVFEQALTIVRKNYVEDVQPKDLMQSAIKGMIGSLEQQSASITQEQFKEMQQEDTGIVISKLLDTLETEVTSDKEIEIFEEALTIVKKNYEEDVKPDTKSKELIYSAIKGLTGTLDQHSAFLTPDQFEAMQLETKGEFGGIGIQTGIKNGKITVIDTLEDTPAYRAGIEAGDYIIKIDNELTKDMSLNDAVSKMRGIPLTTLTLTIQREGWKGTKDFTIARETIEIESVNAKMLEDNIGYIKINQFQEQTESDFSTALSELAQENMESLIIDLRNNPGGLLHSAVKVASHFIPSGKLVVYTENKSGKRKEYRSAQDELYSSIPIIVLVNGGSASASEILAGALKDWNRAVILGTTTYGKGSVQSVVPLKDGSALKLTIAKYYTPKGISIQTIGITPDVVVKPKEIVPITSNNNEDIQLQRAIDLL